MRSAHTILVVDDRAASLYAASRLLRHAGFNTVEAMTGEKAMALADACSAVLLDVNLPDTNGVAVCQFIKANSPKPVILMSASYTDDLHRGAGLQAGADGYLVPPLDGRAMVSAFDRLLGQGSASGH